MTRPLLLDLFCGAGGSAEGYSYAGFDVVGIDNRPQPRYPFPFCQGDALSVMRTLIAGGPFRCEPDAGAGRRIRLKDIDAIHASPPCQRYSEMTACRPGHADGHADLISATRDLLVRTRKPYVIENVGGARKELRNPVFLCGHMFDLELYRHRWFETSFPVAVPPHQKHHVRCSKAGHWEPGTIVSVCGNFAPIEKSKKAMGINWMRRNELSQAIPPAYTEFLGKQLLAAVNATSLDLMDDSAPEVSAAY